MRILKANNAVRLVVGPFISITDGYTLKTGLTVTGLAMNMWHEHDDGSAPVKSIDAVAFTASGGSNDMVELAGGYYDIEITATQLNQTAARCKFQIYDIDQILPYFEDWLILPANVFDAIMGTDYLDVSAVQLAGTALTGRDIGASVLLSSGSGAGQLDFTSGVVKANLAQILGTALTETAGQIAAAFKKFFDKATPTGTINSLPDAVAGAASGVAIVGSEMGLANDAITAAKIAADAIGASELAADAVTEIQNGLATASALATIDTVVDAIKLKTDNLPSDPADQSAVEAAITAATSPLATASALDAVDNFVDTEVSAIKTVTDKLDTALELDGAVYRYTTNALELSPAGGSAPTVEQIRTEMDTNSTQLATIKAKTDNLPTDPADESALEALIDALPTAAEIDTQLSGVHGAGAWGSGGNGGALTLTYTLTDSVSGLPVEGATVELYPTSARTGTPIDSQETNVLGVATFSSLVAGTYYLKIIRSGYETGTDTEVVA